MSVKSGQSVTVTFDTANPTTGAAQDGDSLPTATLYVNGTANAATVTVTNITTGRYKAAVTLPALSAGDVVSIGVAATVATVAGSGIVFADTCDKRVADLNDAAAAPSASANATAVRSELATEMGRIDATVSSRNAVAPDNAGIAAVKAKTDSLTFTTPGKVDASATVDTTGLALEATAQSILEDTGTTLPAAIAAVSGSPSGWTPITADTLDTDGTKLDLAKVGGSTAAAFGMLIEARDADGDLVNSTKVAGTDGVYSLPVPPGATYTVRFNIARATTIERTVIVSA